MSNRKMPSLSIIDISLSEMRKMAISSFYNNAFNLILNSAVASFLGFVFWGIMARGFTAGEVGLGSALMAAMGLVSSISHFGFGIGMIRFIPEIKDRSKDLINSILFLVFVTTCIAAFIYVLGIRVWSPKLAFLQTETLLGIGFILTAAMGVISTILDFTFIAKRQSQVALWKNIVINLIKMPLPLLLFFNMGGYGIFISNGVAIVAGLALSFLVFMPRVYSGFRLRPMIKVGLIREVLPFTLSNYLSGLFVNAIGYVFPLMVLNLYGSEENAYFFMAWMIYSVVSIIPVGISTSILAECSYTPQKLEYHVKRGLLLCGILLIIAVVALYLLAGLILSFFGPAYVLHSLPVLRILLLANFPLTINSFFNSINQVKKRMLYILIQAITTSALTMGLGYWLLERLGPSGIGIAYTLANLVIALAVVVPLWLVVKEV